MTSSVVARKAIRGYTVHPAVQRDKNAQTNNSQNKHVIRSHSTRKDSHPVLHCVAPRAGLSQKNGDSLKFSSPRAV